MRYRKAIQAGLFAIILATWVWSGIEPYDLHAWLLENILVLIAVPLGVFLVRYFHLSLLSQVLFTLFIVLHLVGAHYTYAQTPFGFTLGSWLGTDRNIYDRLVHFSFGLLLAFPIRDMFFRVARVRGIWGYIFPLDITLSLSAVYEILEWGAFKFSSQQTGERFMGMQNDPWDATLDMTSAALGALITLVCIGLVNWRYSQPFREEMKESLKVANKTYQSPSEVNIKEVIRDEKRRRKERRERRYKRKTMRRLRRKQR